MPNEKITGLFWSDRNAQILPYDRGCLYFYQIDAQIRKASGGKRPSTTLFSSFSIEGRTDIG
jgi:hypothetical protein